MIYKEIEKEILLDIFSEKYKQGERLPSMREFAKIYNINININTVQRAMRNLKMMGLIVTHRTNGNHVINDKKLISKYRIMYINTLDEIYKKEKERLKIEDE